MAVAVSQVARKVFVGLIKLGVTPGGGGNEPKVGCEAIVFDTTPLRQLLQMFDADSTPYACLFEKKSCSALFRIRSSWLT